MSFLNEHYRSMPPIIAFSEFYGQTLRVMTERPDTVAQTCVDVHYVSGRRDGCGANPGEARALIDHLVRWIDSELPLEPGLCHSVGVLSPFREQVEHLFEGIRRHLELGSIEKHRLLVGTAHSFQGEERDVMFLSLVIDSEAHPASVRFLNKPDVFNVSITRARDHQVVFCSVRPEGLEQGSLLRRYLEMVSGGPARSLRERAAGTDLFLREVEEHLRRAGANTWVAYRVAGLTIDLVVEMSGRTLGIDLIGHPGDFADALDLERYRMLRRAGLSLFPMSYWAWQRNREACVRSVLERLKPV